MMAAAAKFRDDISGALGTAGISTAYTVSTNQSFDTLAHLDKALLTIVPHTDSGAAPTLNVDGLGARAINATSGVAVASGALKAATPYHLVYFNATTEFILVNPFIAAMITAGFITTAMIADANVTKTKIENIAHGKILARLSASAGVVEEAIIPFGQCRLTKSGTTLLLSPLRGNLLTVNSLAETIPDSGPTLSTSGLSSSTLYYIYAFMNSGTMTLEASVTGYATQAGTGVTIKSGDVTRTLVGMARTDGSTAWTDSATQRFVRSYFNDPGIALLNSFSADRTQTSVSYVEINSEIRCEFLVWAGETIQLQSNGQINSAAPNANAQTSLGIDGTTAEDTLSDSNAFSNNTDQGFSTSLFKTGLTEGYHYATVIGKSSLGAITYRGSGSVGLRTTLRGFAKS
jgi:hypothetical protein